MRWLRRTMESLHVGHCLEASDVNRKESLEAAVEILHNMQRTRKNVKALILQQSVNWMQLCGFSSSCFRLDSISLLSSRRVGFAVTAGHRLHLPLALLATPSW